jgi:broad specificity phosphatase PhoE
VIFVRHGRAIVGPDVPESEWSLDPAFVDRVGALRPALPDLPVACSDMRRAIETAAHFGSPAIDARLREVARPWVADLERDVERYLAGEILDEWEPQAYARARFRAVLDDHARAIYVTHGTVLTLYLASVVPSFDAMRFWTGLTFPDAWELDATRLTRLSAGGD